MPRVFAGRVVIPGDRILEYAKFMEEVERAREPFVRMTRQALNEFVAYLETEKGLSRATVRRHAMVIEMFNEFLARYTDVQGYSEVTRGIANTHFKAWYRRKVWGGPPLDQVRVSVHKFFRFLADRKGVVNEKVLGK